MQSLRQDILRQVPGGIRPPMPIMPLQVVQRLQWRKE